MFKIPATALELLNETLQKSHSTPVLRKTYDMRRKGHWRSTLVSVCNTIYHSNIFLTPKHAHARRSLSTVGCRCVIWTKTPKVNWIFCNTSISNFVKLPYVVRIFLNIRIDGISRWDTKCPFRPGILVQACSHSFTESKEPLITNVKPLTFSCGKRILDYTHLRCNPSKPGVCIMCHRVYNSAILRFAHTVYIRVLYGSVNKERKFPYMLICFCYRHRICLLRGTDWIFIYTSGYSLRWKG